MSTYSKIIKLDNGVDIGTPDYNNICVQSQNNLPCIHPEVKFLYYDLSIKPDIEFNNSNNITASSTIDTLIGEIKYDINLDELIKSTLCYHNECAFKYMLDKYNWRCHYASDMVINLLNCHVIDYTIIKKQHITLKPIKFNIHILFFSLKCNDTLTPICILNDLTLVSILKNHIIIYNNLIMSDYHNYRIGILYEEISKLSKCNSNTVLDKIFKPIDFCKTKLYNFQCNNIQWMLNLEKNLPFMNFTNSKIFDLGPKIGLYFNFDNIYNTSQKYTTSKYSKSNKEFYNVVDVNSVVGGRNSDSDSTSNSDSNNY